MAYKILVVEDEALLMRLEEMTLQMAGFRTVTALDGEEALTRARDERPDLILLDIKLPKLDGFEVSRRLKADPELADIPVIFATADATIRMGNCKEKYGVADYMIKPFEMDLMVSKIQNCLTKTT